MARRIGDLLVEAGVLTEAQLQQALDRQQTEGEERIASELFALGLVHERALCEALAERHGDPALVLSASVLDLRALGLVPRIIAERNTLLPVAIDDACITLAVPDGDLGPILEQVQFASGRQVIAVVAVRKIIADAIGPAYEASRRGEKTLAGHHAKDRGDTPHLEIVRAVPADSEAAQAALVEALVEHSDDDASIDLLAPGHAASVLQPPPATPSAESPAAGGDDEPSGGVPVARIALKRVPVLRQARAPFASPAAVEAVDVVLAEDDLATAELIKKVLSHDGYQVRHADSGSSAVELLRHVRPHLILLDAMLPPKDAGCIKPHFRESFRTLLDA